MKKFKPYCGFAPLPILPAAQINATSYAQHLAYLEWYIKYLQDEIEHGAGGTGELIQVYGLATTIGSNELNVPVFEGYNNSNGKLTVDNGQIVVGAGVSHIKVSGYCSLFFTSSAARNFGVVIKKSSTTKAAGWLFAPASASEGSQIMIPDQIVEVSEGDTFDVYVENMYTNVSSMNAQPKIVIEVID